MLLEADPTSAGFFRIKELTFDEPTGSGTTGFRDDVKQEVTDLIVEWLGTIEEELATAGAKEQPPVQLDGALVFFNRELGYDEDELVDKQVWNPELNGGEGGYETIQAPKEFVKKRWILFVAKVLP